MLGFWCLWMFLVSGRVVVGLTFCVFFYWWYFDEDTRKMALPAVSEPSDWEDFLVQQRIPSPHPCFVGEYTSIPVSQRFFWQQRSITKGSEGLWNQVETWHEIWSLRSSSFRCAARYDWVRQCSKNRWPKTGDLGGTGVKSWKGTITIGRKFDHASCVLALG